MLKNIYYLIKAELLKLLDKRTLIITVLLLAANLISMFFAVHTEANEYMQNTYSEYWAAFEEFEKLYADAPEYYDQYYNKLELEFIEEQQKWEDSLSDFTYVDSGSENFSFEYHSMSTIIDGFEDYDLMTKFFYLASDYKKTLEATTESARKTLTLLERFGVKDNSKNAKYQKRLIEIFTYTYENINETPGITRGWEDILTYENHLVFIFLIVVIVSVQTAISDYENGYEPVLRTCRKGRVQRGIAKCISLFVFMTTAVLLIVTSEIILEKMLYGVSSPFRAIQNVASYVYCPYVISIFDVVVLNVIGLIFASVLLGSIVIMITVISRMVILPLISGGLLLAGNLLIHWMPSRSEYMVFNIVEAASGKLLQKPPSVSLISLGNSLYPLEITALITLCLISFGVFVIVLAHIRPSGRKTKMGLSELKLPAFCHGSEKKRSKQISMGFAEVLKATSIMTLAVVLLLVICRVKISCDSFDPLMSDVKLKTAEYIEKYGGVISREKYDTMSTELLYLHDYIKDETRLKMVTSRASGKITEEEYYSYLENAGRVKSALPAFSDLVEHAEYLLQKADESGLETELFYEYGYSDFFGTGFDLPLYLLIVFVLSALFAKEYSDGAFVKVLRTTKFGREKVFLTKLKMSVIWSGGLSLAFSCLDFSLMFREAGAPALTAPLCSIEKYSAAVFKITVGQYLFLATAVRIIGAVLLALICTALSCILSNAKHALAVTAAVTLTPYALYYFGIQGARYFDFTALFSCDRLFLISISHGGIAFFIIFIVIFSALASGLTVMAYRKFCK